MCYPRIFCRPSRTLRHMVNVTRGAKARRGPFSVIATMGLSHRIRRFHRHRYNAKGVIATTVSTMNTVRRTMVYRRGLRWEGTATVLNGTVAGTPPYHASSPTTLILSQHSTKDTECVMLNQFDRCFRFFRRFFIRGYCQSFLAGMEVVFCCCSTLGEGARRPCRGFPES